MDTRGWSDIAYSFLVHQNGDIYEGRGWGIAGGHTRGYNFVSHAFCFIGNAENIAPTAAAEASIAWLIDEAERKYGSQLVQGHRQAASTACPGRYLYARIDDIVNINTPSSAPAFTLKRGDNGEDVRKLQIILNTFAETGLQIDGDYGALTEAAVRKYQKILSVPQDGVWGPTSTTTHDAFMAYLEAISKAPDPKPADLPSGSGNKILQRGWTGPEVTKLQEALVYLNPNLDLNVDGIFGVQTENNIRDIQGFFKIEGGVNGVVGSATWDVIDFLVSKKRQTEADAEAQATAKAAEEARLSAERAQAEAEAKATEQERIEALAKAEQDRQRARAAQLEAENAAAVQAELEDLLERDRIEEVNAELERIRKENEELAKENAETKSVLRKIIDFLMNMFKFLKAK